MGNRHINATIGGFQSVTSTTTAQGSGPITGAVVQLTAHVATGAFTLPAGQPAGASIVVLNLASTGFAAQLFPPANVVSVSGPTTWAGKINDLADAAAITIPSGKTAICTPVPDITGQKWMVVISA